MNTLEFLDACKTRLDIKSDYALAKALHVGQPTVIGYRSGRTTISDDTALSIAEILNIDPLFVIATANAERAKTPAKRARWAGVMEKLSVGFNTLISGYSPRPASF